MFRETHLYEERVSGKGLTLLCEAVDISSTGATNLVRDKKPPDINDSAVGVDSNISMTRVTENCVPTGGGVNSPGISDSAVCTDIKVPMTKVTENSDSVKIEITFVTGTRGRFIVNKRKRGTGFSLYVYASSGLTGGRYRYLYFKTRYRCRELFRRFVVDQLKKCVSTWKSRGDAQQWCESNLDRFKQRVETEWTKQLEKLPKKRLRSTRDENRRIRSARCSNTISIPLYGFLLEGQVPVIRITYAWHRNTKPYLLICFPGVIFADKKPRKKSLKYRFGHDRQWSRFVEGYVKAAVNQCQTLEDVRIWYRDSGFEFWTNRLWEINKSKKKVQHGNS